MDTEYLSLVGAYRQIVSEKELGLAKHDLWQAQMDQRLDTLYEQIISTPVTTLEGAVAKLQFALLCLTHEDDYKEAADLVQEVADALGKMGQAQKDAARVA